LWFELEKTTAGALKESPLQGRKTLLREDERPEKKFNQVKKEMLLSEHKFL